VLGTSVRSPAAQRSLKVTQTTSTDLHENVELFQPGLLVYTMLETKRREVNVYMEKVAPQNSRLVITYSGRARTEGKCSARTFFNTHFLLSLRNLRMQIFECKLAVVVAIQNAVDRHLFFYSSRANRFGWCLPSFLPLFTFVPSFNFHEAGGVRF